MSAAAHFADRVLEVVARKKTPAAVAIDPVLERLPAEFRSTHGNGGDIAGIETFCRELIDIVAPIVPIVKFNSAYFECYHAEGIRVYDQLVGEAQDHGLIVIGDVKRGDVGHTAEMYATAHLGIEDDATGVRAADAITINGYLGADGVLPFAQAATKNGQGIFVLVRTSNPSAAVVQDLAASDGRPVHEHVAEMVVQCAEKLSRGARGYSSIGAVVATRDARHAGRLREIMKQSLFLVPGYGAQGGTAGDFAPYFQDGHGALIVAGRSVIFAYQNKVPPPPEGRNWRDSVRCACQEFAADVAKLIR